MPNTSSAKKAVRSSQKKKEHNQFWKNRVKNVVGNIQESLDSKTDDVDLLQKQLSTLQKVVDKASKEKVISKNKANRLKSKYANKISVQTPKSSTKKSK